MEDIESEIKPRRPRKRGFIKKKEKDRKPSPVVAQLTFDEFITVEIEKYKELWLERVNVHLDKLLKNSKRDNSL